MFLRLAHDGTATAPSTFVITGLSRSKNGVASLAYDPVIHLWK
jgi:hypothetical protein